MNVYEKVLERLLLESNSLNKLPDPGVLKSSFTLINKHGFKHYLKRVVGDVFFVEDPDGNIQKYTFKELIKNFKGE